MNQKKVVIIAVNERGHRIGESHHNAKIPQEIVDRMRDLHEDEGVTYEALAKMFNLTVPTVAKICRYERRAQTPDRYKRVVQEDGQG